MDFDDSERAIKTGNTAINSIKLLTNRLTSES